MRSVIDSHVHLYPAEVSADPLGWAARHNELHWAELIAATDERPSLQGWVDVDTLLADMSKAGVTEAILLGWYWENQDTCEMQNRWYAQWAAAHPGELHWFATIQPASGARAVEEVRRAFDAGASGIGELSPAAQAFSVRDDTFRRVVELAIEWDLPVNFHVNEPLGRRRAGRRFDRFEDFQWLAATYPDLKIILAHWGGLSPFYELNRAVRRDFRNVFYDTAASPLLYDSRIYRAVVDIVGPDKILFGSDYPLLLYPRRDKFPGFARLVEETCAAGLTEAELKLILHDNARRLLTSKAGGTGA